MFLKFLDKIGRKKVVLDRGPSHPKYHEAKPWMNRYYLIFRHRPKWFPFNILIHEMLADDHGKGVHNHTFPYITIILRDGYWETLKNVSNVFQENDENDINENYELFNIIVNKLHLYQLYNQYILPLDTNFNDLPEINGVNEFPEWNLDIIIEKIVEKKIVTP